MLVSVLMDNEEDFKALLRFYDFWQSPLTASAPGKFLGSEPLASAD